ncbi:MAG TPA: GNAT family N-acetyltransferase [Candidatus Kapabacteria bacterium]|nr:GNAT family N-acetyltransferase [Candidatus Kapabacteria bacterium]
MFLLDPIGEYAFRPATEEDEAFVRSLYSITLRSQMPFEETNLSNDEIEALIQYQFNAQTLHYTSNYPFADISIIHNDDEPVGRLIIIEFEDEVRLGDLMILPAHQNRGICSSIMDRYVRRGLETKRPIRLHVEKANRAVNLYRRKRFAVVEDLSSHWLMEYQHEPLPGDAGPARQ